MEDTPEFKQFADQFTKSGGNFFVGTAIIAIAWMMRSLTRPDTQEISFQHFKTQLLAKDVVDRIEVANKTTAKVISTRHCCIITADLLLQERKFQKVHEASLSKTRSFSSESHEYSKQSFAFEAFVPF